VLILTYVRRLAISLAAVLLLTISSAGAREAPGISARSAIVINCETGRVLYEKNADARMLIASTTKIMTALIVLEKCRPNEIVAIKPEYTGIEGSSSYLAAGESLTVRELLYCLLLQSGNDSAVALACHTAGSIDEFAKLMNDKASELGCVNSSFKNPHGLDEDGHYSCARDLAAITRAAMEHKLFRTIVATESCSIGTRYLSNHNKLLSMYSGCTGVKTGYTKAAGRSLVSSAEKHSERLIAVTLNDPNDWEDHRAMLDYGFENFHTVAVCNRGDVLASIPVVGGAQNRVRAYAADTINVTLAEGETVETKLFLPQFCYAEVRKGEYAGFLEIYIDGEKAGETQLLYGDSIAWAEPERNFLAKLWDSIF
jgi:D-alanyl-D-alanine carboxypeptidase (penicillin-binding protein 5/6)